MSNPLSPDFGDFDGPELKPRPHGRIISADHPSAPPSQPPTPGADAHPTTAAPHASQRPTASPIAATEDSSTPNRTKSLLNLTASTLFGIYQPTGYAADREEPSTPWGTGAQTPIDSQRPSFDAPAPRSPTP
ncbi:Insulin-induced protein (INSIG), partial [Teratosphaeria destructans]